MNTIPSRGVSTASKWTFAHAGEGQSDLFSAQAPAVEDAEVARARALAERVASLDPDALSPREALDALYELKRLASAD